MKIDRPTQRRKRLALLLLALSVAVSADVAGADDIPVPYELQAQLLSKVLTYDRSLNGRAGDRVHGLLVGKPAVPTSMPAIRQMRQALGGLDNLGALPHDEEIVEFTTPAELAERCKANKVSLVYLGPGFHGDVEAIRAALEPFSIMTVSANPDDVPRGIVLGFDLISGRPKLIVHLTQARRQRVDLTAEVLKLMRVIE